MSPPIYYLLMKENHHDLPMKLSCASVQDWVWPHLSMPWLSGRNKGILRFYAPLLELLIHKVVQPNTYDNFNYPLLQFYCKTFRASHPSHNHQLTTFKCHLIMGSCTGKGIGYGGSSKDQNNLEMGRNKAAALNQVTGQ